MGRDRTRIDRDPQASLQIRHALLSRPPAERAQTRDHIAAKRTHRDKTLATFEQRLFSVAGKVHFTQLPPALAYLVERTTPVCNTLFAALHADEFTPLLAAMNDMQMTLSGVVAHVRRGADSVGEISGACADA